MCRAGRSRLDGAHRDRGRRLFGASSCLAKSSSFHEAGEFIGSTETDHSGAYTISNLSPADVSFLWRCKSPALLAMVCATLAAMLSGCGAKAHHADTRAAAPIGGTVAPASSGFGSGKVGLAQRGPRVDRSGVLSGAARHTFAGCAGLPPVAHLPSLHDHAEGRGMALELLPRLDGLRELLANMSGTRQARRLTGLRERFEQLDLLTRRELRGGRETPKAMLDAVAKLSVAADRAGLGGCAMLGI